MAESSDLNEKRDAFSSSRPMSDDSRSMREACLAALDAAIARGVADSQAGQFKPVDAVFDRLESKYRNAARR